MIGKIFAHVKGLCGYKMIFLLLLSDNRFMTTIEVE